MPAEAPDIHAIFNEAVARQSDEDRLRYLDEVCGEAPDVRRRVEALLRALVGGTGSPSAPARAAEPFAVPENLRRFFAGKRAKAATTEAAGASTCCPPSELATCCAPEEKSGCCDPAASSCGCN